MDQVGRLRAGAWEQSMEHSPDKMALGRTAATPWQIGGRGWWRILRRVQQGIGNDNLNLAAGGIAYYGLLALVPALVAAVGLYGLVNDPQTVRSQLEAATGYLPASAQPLLDEQLTQLATAAPQGLGLGSLLSLLLAIYGASRAANGLIMGLNMAYEEQETRGFVALTLRSLLFTVGGIIFLLVGLSLVIGVPVWLASLNLPDAIAVPLRLLWWLVPAAMFTLALALAYGFGPARRRARWQWLSAGSVLGTLIWLAGSAGFFVYVNNFSNYNATYGSLGAVVILLIWFYLSAFAVLLGAKLNAEMEHQTGRDTTIGPDRPRGKRDAFVADHLPNGS